MSRSPRPAVEQVAGRLVILKHVVVFAGASMPGPVLRRHLDSWTEQDQEDFSRKAEDQRAQFWRRLQDAGLWKEMSPREHAFAKSMVTLSEQDRVDASWRLEAAQVLLWALDRVPDLPPYDTMADREVLKQIPPTVAAGTPWKLRTEAEIARARDVAEMWHWRSRTRQLIERGDDLLANPMLGEKLRRAGFRHYDDIVRACAKQAAANGAIAACVDEDFPAKGKAYRDLEQQEWSQIRSITVERHFALNWLCGHAPSNRWDETPTDT